MSELTIRFLLVFLVVSSLTLVAYWQLDCPNVGIDDANIFFVYAKNLVHGHGFVFNAGEERVEGFSSLLWVLLVSILYRFSSSFEVYLLILNMLMASLTITIVTDYFDSMFHSSTDRRRVPSIFSLVVLLLVAMSPSYVIWVTLTLKEEGLWSLLLVTATVLLLRLKDDPKGGRKLAVVIGMMLLVRPEAMLWCLVCALLAAVVRVSDRDRAETSDHALLPLITYICVLLSVTLFRVVYFGVPLPNTFYAKVSPSVAYNLRTGTEYFMGYFRSGLLIRFAVLVLAIYVVLSVLDIVHVLRSVVRRDAPESIWKNRLEVFPLLVATCLVIPVLVGGDHFVGYRFFQPAYPLLILSPFMFMKYLERKGLIRWVFAPRGAAISGFVLLLLVPVFALSQQVTWFNVERTLPIMHEFKIAESGRIIGGLMSRVFSELESFPSVGLVTVGGIKYGYEGPVVDLMGLNNSVIGRSSGDRKGFKAHAAFERELFFEVEPEVLWDADWDSSCNRDLQGHHDRHGFRWLDEMLEGVLSDPRFLADYRYGQIGLRSSPHGPCVRGFLRLDFIDRATHTDGLNVLVLP